MNLYRLCYKQFLNGLIFVFIIFAFIENAGAVPDPAFQLSLTNRNYISSNEGYFDIVIMHTNSGHSVFKYAGGQFVITLDTTFLSDHLHYIYSKDTATYGTDRIPPQYTGALTRSNDILKIDSGITIAQGSEPVISVTGTLIARIKFYNPDLYSSSCLLEEQFVWKTDSPGDFTKIYARTGGVRSQLNNNSNNFSTAELCQGFTCCLSAPLPPPVRIAPVNNSLNLTAPVTLSWQKGFPVNYSAYLQVALDSGFNYLVHERSITAPNGVSDISVTLDSFTAPGNYYWRVKQGGIPPQGAYNEPWKFSIASPSITLNLTAVPEGLLGTENYNQYEIKVYLRNYQSPFQLVDSSAIMASDTSFTNTFKFSNAPSGNYYIVYTTNNCIETYSRLGGELLLSGSLTNHYDFTASDSLAYGYNVFFAESLYCIFSGDVNQDGIIDVADLLSVYNSSIDFTFYNLVTDINSDGTTDLSDLLKTYNNSFEFISRFTPLDN